MAESWSRDPAGLISYWSSGPRTCRTRRTALRWVTPTLTSLTLAAGRLPIIDIIVVSNHENPQVQHCQDDLPNHRRKSPSVQTLFLVLVCSFRSRRLHQPQDLSVRLNNQILTTKLLMYNLRKPVGAADSDDDDENQTSVG